MAFMNVQPRAQVFSEYAGRLKEFLKFINSREGQEAVVRAGFFPLPAAQVTRNLQNLLGPSMSALVVSQAQK